MSQRPPKACRVSRRFLAAVLAVVLVLPALVLPALIGDRTATAQEGDAVAPRALDLLMNAVVGVRSTVPARARTAGSLGTEREGSGVVIDANGLVVTIGYLILEADGVTILDAENREVPAEILGYDHQTGFGLIRAAVDLQVEPMRLGQAAGLAFEDQVLVAARAGRPALHPAVVTDRRVFAGYWEYLLEDAIFTSPPFRDFGGAALVDQDGRLVGIGSLVVGDALREEGRTVPGNMFVPVDLLPDVMARVLAGADSERPRVPWLGIYTEEQRGRVWVDRLADGGPGEAAGVRPQDMILSVGGTAVADLESFLRTLWATGDAGVEVDLRVLRGDQIQSIKVQTMDRYDWLRLDPTY